MADKKCKCECPECMPEWLATFGDLMSLLLCFFVLLLSMSTMDAKKIAEAVGSLSGSMGVMDGGIIVRNSKEKGSPTSQTPTTATNMDKQIKEAVSEMKELSQSAQGNAISIEEGEEGFLIHLPADITFKSGSAEIANEDSILFLKRIALIIKTLSPEVEVQVRGYTDNIPPPKTSPYQDNWELSAARAITVVKELIKDGVKPTRLSAAAYGQYHPITTNATPAGRAKNRRVDIVFFAHKKQLQNQVAKSVLDKAK
ncbi:MAG: OmpA family protein [Epsilonproteobacteria bacterium]|nr:OmpA family protein [Campylobacterota bacterium]